MDELKPCPFCGSGPARGPGRYTNASFSGVELIHMADKDAERIQCGTCGGEGPIESSEHEAIAAWNRRPKLAADVEAVAWAIHLTRFGDDGSHPSDDDQRMARAAIDAMKLTDTK